MIVYEPIIQEVKFEGNQFDVLRLDLLHEEISGNKWFKLKKNLECARQNNQSLLTFGGPHSNHIAATAAACVSSGIKNFGVIRGENQTTPTLTNAEKNGMHLIFVSREEYARKNKKEYIQTLKDRYGDFHLVPEGGNNTDGISGCMEIIKEEWTYDYFVCACGTGTTFAGLVLSTEKPVIGISVLKGINLLPADAVEHISTFNIYKDVKGNEEAQKKVIETSCITNDYAFSGYAKADQALLEFKKEFEKQTGIFLDYVYTSKLFYGVCDLFKKKKFSENARVLVIHSGGLQGNEAFENRYQLMPKR